MAKLSVFNFLTLNGFYKGEGGDISWHNFGSDEQEMSDQLSNAGNTLLFGRVTYEMMAQYWSSKAALQNDPVTAKGMNSAKKYVFSRTLRKAEWQNTFLIQDDLIGEVRKLKTTSDANLTLLGSGQILTQLADAGLVDEFSFMINPLAIGQGAPIFGGLSKKLVLKLTSTRVMKSGNVILNYTK